MEIETFDTRILRPTDPNGWLTNGETFSKQVYLGRGARVNSWKEITNEEYLKIQEEQEEDI